LYGLTFGKQRYVIKGKGDAGKHQPYATNCVALRINWQDPVKFMQEINFNEIWQ
jgi:hypothetical protein